MPVELSPDLLRHYFAAHAPMTAHGWDDGAPEWFVHTPAPNRPGEQPLPRAATGPESSADRERYNHEYRAMLPEREAHARKVQAWLAADKMARLVQWRIAYADAMVAALSGGK